MATVAEWIHEAAKEVLAHVFAEKGLYGEATLVLRQQTALIIAQHSAPLRYAGLSEDERTLLEEAVEADADAPAD